MRLILQANNIKLQYGARTILEFESFQVYEGDKIGVVGLNGAGKTTLLGVLSGDIRPDEGTVSRSAEAAYIRQFEEIEETLSGGENVKKRILRETGREDGIIFADEPTANLDGDGIQWVRGKLEAAKTVLLISHDRQLLDDICSRIVEVKDGKLRFFTGNYTDYLEQSEQEQERLRQGHEEYRRKKAQLLDAVRVREQKIAHQKRKKKDDLRRNPSEARLGGHKRAASIKKQEHDAKILKARMERLEDVELPHKLQDFRMDFSLTDPPKNRIAIACESLTFSYGAGGRLIFDGASFTIPTGAKMALTGKNGSGKTTLLRLIHERDPRITFAPKLRMGYLYQGFENLREDRTVLENTLEVSIQDRASTYSILAGLLFTGEGFHRKAGVLSGGERIRLALAMLIASDCNGLMLDEPTNYLDIRSVEAVRDMVRKYPGTVIVVSHDRRFLSETTDSELRAENGKIIAAGADAPSSATKPVMDKMLLELRRSKLVGAISSAPPEQKVVLEEEYARVLRDLRQCD